MHVWYYCLERHNKSHAYVTFVPSVNSVPTVITVTTTTNDTTVPPSITTTAVQDDMIRAMAMEQKLKMQQKGNRAMGVL